MNVYVRHNAVHVFVDHETNTMNVEARLRITIPQETLDEIKSDTTATWEALRHEFFLAVASWASRNNINLIKPASLATGERV